MAAHIWWCISSWLCGHIEKRRSHLFQSLLFMTTAMPANTQIYRIYTPLNRRLCVLAYHPLNSRQPKTKQQQQKNDRLFIVSGRPRGWIHKLISRILFTYFSPFFPFLYFSLVVWGLKKRPLKRYGEWGFGVASLLKFVDFFFSVLPRNHCHHQAALRVSRKSWRAPLRKSMVLCVGMMKKHKEFLRFSLDLAFRREKGGKKYILNVCVSGKNVCCRREKIQNPTLADGGVGWWSRCVASTTLFFSCCEGSDNRMKQRNMS